MKDLLNTAAGAGFGIGEHERELDDGLESKRFIADERMVRRRDQQEVQLAGRFDGNRVGDRLIASPSEETTAALVTTCARVEQWMYANTQSRGIAVIDGYAWWWRKMRVPPMRHSMYGSAQSVGDGTYRVTIGAFSTEGRFVSVEFSDDGGTWTPPVPYRVDHEYSANKGAETIFARLSLNGPAGTKLSEPIAIRLN